MLALLQIINKKYMKNRVHIMKDLIRILKKSEPYILFKKI